MPQLFTIAKYSILEVVRNKLLVFILAGIAVFFCLVLFIGDIAMTESATMQAAILAWMLRLFAVALISLFVISNTLREFNDQGTALILSHALTRSSYYFGKLCGFSVIAVCIPLLSVACLSVYAPVDMVLCWSLSLYCELLIIVALSLLGLFSFNNTPIAFGTVMAFYMLARCITLFQNIGDSSLLASTSLSHKFMSHFLDAVAYLLPDLDRFTQTEWLVYAEQTDVNIVAIMSHTLIYLVFISCVALFDLYRKEL